MRPSKGSRPTSAYRPGSNLNRRKYAAETNCGSRVSLSSASTSVADGSGCSVRRGARGRVVRGARRCARRRSSRWRSRSIQRSLVRLPLGFAQARRRRTGPGCGRRRRRGCTRCIRGRARTAGCCAGPITSARSRSSSTYCCSLLQFSSRLASTCAMNASRSEVRATPALDTRGRPPPQSDRHERDEHRDGAEWVAHVC